MRYIKANRHGGHQARINRIVMHSTVSPCGPGWAVKMADMFHTTTVAKSAHYVVDCDEIVRCLPDHTIAYHAPPNTGSIGVEQCDWSKGSKARWRDAEHTAMLHRAARLVARLCETYDIPVRHIGPAELRAGGRGICGHIDVTRAWHQTTHTDPAGFPWGRFLRMVRAGGGAVEDEDTMDRASLSISKPVKLNPHTTTVGFDTRHGSVPGWKPGHPSILRGPCDYQAGYVGQVTGLAQGTVVDVSVVEAVKHGSGKDKGWRVGRPVGVVPPLVADSDGTARFAVDSLPGGHLPKHGRVWLRFDCRGADGARLVWCNAQAWYQD